MGKKTKGPNQPRGDVKELLDFIGNAVRSIQALKDDRSEVNADIENLMAQLVAMGIKRKAVAWAMAYSEWDTDDRAGFDVAYNLVRQAIGVPMEDQLFDAEGKPNLAVPAIKAKSDQVDAEDPKLPEGYGEGTGGDGEEEGDGEEGEEIIGDPEPDATQEIAEAVAHTYDEDGRIKPPDPTEVRH